MDTRQWVIAEGLARWFDGCPAESEQARILLRALKLSEEVGEIAEELVRLYGGNPRKPEPGSIDKVRKETGDVVITGMMLLASITPDAAAFFTVHAETSWDRALMAGAPSLPEAPRATDADDELVFRPGQQIKVLRAAYGLTTTEFARLMQLAGDEVGYPNACTRATVSEWERGTGRYIMPYYQPALRHLARNFSPTAERASSGGKKQKSQ